MVVQIVPFLQRFGSSSRQDWSNEEISQLYRVENALVQLNIQLETDRGLSDEGDPWFVFCRRDGEVLVHIARFDSSYHLHAPTVPLHLCGASFVELTRTFVDRYPLNVPVKRGAKVILHPAAIFTALVAAAFFAADNNAQAAVIDGGGTQPDVLTVGTASASVSFIPRNKDYQDLISTKHGGLFPNNLSAYLNVVAATAVLVLDIVPGDVLIPAMTVPTSIDDIASLHAGDGALHTKIADIKVLEHERTVDSAAGYPSSEAATMHNSAVVGSIETGISPTNNASFATPLLENQIFNQTLLPAPQFDDGSLHLGVSEFSNLARVVVRGSGAAETVHDSGRGGDSISHDNITPSSGAFDAHTDSAIVANLSETAVSISSPSASAIAVWSRVAELIKDHTIDVQQEAIETVAHAQASSASPELSATTVEVSPVINGSVEPEGPRPTMANTAVSTADDNHFTAAVSAVVKDFVLSNPTVKFFSSHNSIIVFDGLTAVEDSSPLVVKTWHFDNGGTISIVGHADNPIHYDWVS